MLVVGCSNQRRHISVTDCGSLPATGIVAVSRFWCIQLCAEFLGIGQTIDFQDIDTSYQATLDGLDTRLTNLISAMTLGLRLPASFSDVLSDLHQLAQVHIHTQSHTKRTEKKRRIRSEPSPILTNRGSGLATHLVDIRTFQQMDTQIERDTLEQGKLCVYVVEQLIQVHFVHFEVKAPQLKYCHVSGWPWRTHAKVSFPVCRLTRTQGPHTNLPSCTKQRRQHGTWSPCSSIFP